MWRCLPAASRSRHRPALLRLRFDQASRSSAIRIAQGTRLGSVLPSAAATISFASFTRGASGGSRSESFERIAASFCMSWRAQATFRSNDRCLHVSGRDQDWGRVDRKLGMSPDFGIVRSASHLAHSARDIQIRLRGKNKSAADLPAWAQFLLMTNELPHARQLDKKSQRGAVNWQLKISYCGVASHLSCHRDCELARRQNFYGLPGNMINTIRQPAMRANVGVAFFAAVGRMRLDPFQRHDCLTLGATWHGCKMPQWIRTDSE